MKVVVVDYFTSVTGEICGRHLIDADDPATIAMLADLDAHPEKRAAAGYADVCTYHGAAPGLTRWHHLQAAKVVSGVPAVALPVVAPQVGESAQAYALRVQKAGV